MSTVREQYLEAIGITVWSQRNFDENKTLIPDLSQQGWDELKITVEDCIRCELCHGRTQTVFGVGDHGADLLIIGEAPGAEEDQRGEPFVGRAGQLLDAMLSSIHLSLSLIHISEPTRPY